eukprot:10841331-Alexandrium_andersonii.AAC.1
MAEHVGQAPARPIPIPASNSQKKVDRYVVAVGTKVNNLGVDLWKVENMPAHMSPTYATDPGDLPEFWGTAPADWSLQREHTVQHRYRKAR